MLLCPNLYVAPRYNTWGLFPILSLPFKMEDSVVEWEAALFYRGGVSNNGEYLYMATKPRKVRHIPHPRSKVLSLWEQGYLNCLHAPGDEGDSWCWAMVYEILSVFYFVFIVEVTRGVIACIKLGYDTWLGCKGVRVYLTHRVSRSRPPSN